MSVPARGLAGPEPSAPAQRRARSAREPAARPRTSLPPQPSRRARRGSHPAFWILTSAVVTSMVLGVVSLSAMLVQGGFHVDDMQARIAGLNERSQELTLDVARLSAPARVAEWARAHGMVTPDRAVVIRVRPQGDA